MSTIDIETERNMFEERAFSKYFLSHVRRSSCVTGPALTVAPSCKTKAQFCERDEEGGYVDSHLDAMWWAWQQRASKFHLSPESLRRGVVNLKTSLLAAKTPLDLPADSHIERALLTTMVYMFESMPHWQKPHYTPQHMGVSKEENVCIHSAIAPNMNRCIKCGKKWDGEQWIIEAQPFSEPPLVGVIGYAQLWFGPNGQHTYTFDVSRDDAQARLNVEYWYKDGDVFPVKDAR